MFRVFSANPAEEVAKAMNQFELENPEEELMIEAAWGSPWGSHVMVRILDKIMPVVKVPDPVTPQHQEITVGGQPISLAPGAFSAEGIADDGPEEASGEKSDLEVLAEEIGEEA